MIDMEQNSRNLTLKIGTRHKKKSIKTIDIKHRYKSARSYEKLV